MLNILKNEGNFTVENCWERDNANADAPLVTFGESYMEKQADGTMKEIPMETLLTTPIDQCYNNCLSYIFQMGQTFKPTLKVSET